MGKRVQGKLAVKRISAAAVMVILIVLLWNGTFAKRQSGKDVICDINGDGQEERISLTENHVRVSRQEAVLWQSDEEWEVTDFLVADIDGDDTVELLLLLWKKGSFGEYTPFWIEDDGQTVTQHIFIYRMDEDKMKAVWMSSQLKPQVRSWDLAKENRIHIITDSGEDTIWMWGQWGLERVP